MSNCFKEGKIMNIKCYYKNAKIQSMMCLFSLFFMIIVMWNLFKITYLIGTIFWILLYFTVIFLTNKFANKKYTVGISLIISIVILMLFFANYIFICLDITLKETEHPTDDIKRYGISNKQLLKVFPKKIPKSAVDAHYMYAPGFLQAPSRYILYYTDKTIDINKFDKKYRKNAKWTGYKKDMNNNIFEENDLVLTSSIFSETPIKVSEDYKIYLYDYECDNSGWCNHGNYLYSAVNENTYEIVYKASQW